MRVLLRFQAYQKQAESPLYPSPAFPNPVRSAPGVGSTHYFAAYTCVHGHYPPLKGRIEAGAQPSAEDPAVLELLRRVDVIGHRDRPAFAPLD